MRKGFTLIELMIVVAIIAVIAAIAIPSLLRARQAANETNAGAACKGMAAHQAVWRRTDADGNGVQDYWTADVAAFYAMTDGMGNILKYIDVAQAKADYAPNPGAAATYTLKYPAGTAGGVGNAVPKSGYYYAMLRIDEGGTAYARDTSPRDGLGNPYNNTSDWAMCAFPATYNKSGIRAFIANVEGVVYGTDNGENVATHTGNPVTVWPGADPTLQTGIAGKPWAVIQE